MLFHLLEPPAAVLTHPVVPGFAGLHVLSLCLLLYTVYLQAQALAFDHADVSRSMLLLGGGPIWLRNRMALPVFLAGIVLDTACLLFFL